MKVTKSVQRCRRYLCKGSRRNVTKDIRLARRRGRHKANSLIRQGIYDIPEEIVYTNWDVI